MVRYRIGVYIIIQMHGTILILNNTIIIMLSLCIANCGHPEMLFTVRNDSDSVPNIVATDNLIPIEVEGATVTFSCPPGFELIGSRTATCTENRKWEPDPSGLMCNISNSKGNSVGGYTKYHAYTNSANFVPCG
jgi:hypothetical protein